MTARCTSREYPCFPRRRQLATIDRLSTEMVAALDRRDWELSRSLDHAIGRALESPGAAEGEEKRWD